VIIVLLPNSYAAGVILAPGSYGGIAGSVVYLREPFGKIKPETIYFVLLHPEFDYVFHKIFGCGAFMVKLVTYIIWMRRIYIIPGIVYRRLSCCGIKIHLYHRRLAE